MIHTDKIWKCSIAHITGLREMATTCGSFHKALIEAWLLGSSSNKKSLEKEFLFLSDEDNFVTEEEYNQKTK